MHLFDKLCFGAAFIVCSFASADRDPAFPPMKLDFINIKGPQMIGIIAGCLVFMATISVVIYLLYMSGSFSKLLIELQSNEPLKFKKEADSSPQFRTMPELYEHLLKATTTLKLQPSVSVLSGKLVSVRNYEEEKDLETVWNACNGTAQYHESSYDPARIWGWMDSFDASAGKALLAAKESADGSDDAVVWPSATKQHLAITYSPDQLVNGRHLVIVDRELDRQIGMFSLVDNCPRNLSVRIDNLWITPAFQGKRRAHEAMLLILTWLHDSGYRRITAEVDERHVISRKFLERCGFAQEAVLRKHKVVQRRNRNTALYVVLNSEWAETEVRLKRLLGISLGPVAHKVAEIDLRPEQPSGASTQQKKKNKGGKSKKSK